MQLPWNALSANKEITELKRTRRTRQKELSLKSTASSVKNTPFTRKLSKKGE